jgi:hypothetical protein
MGDTTNFQLTIYDCPDDQRESLVQVIQDLRQDGDFSGAPSEGFDELELMNAYTDGLASLTAHDDYATDIIEAAPGATFVCWTDPKYEWLGGLVMYTPNLGRFDADCDANGVPAIGPYAILQAVVDQPENATRDEILDALGKLTGWAWLDRVHLLEQKAQLGSQSATLNGIETGIAEIREHITHAGEDGR